MSRSEGKELSTLVAMRRITLFLDGMSRTAILPFGPILIYRILISRVKNESIAIPVSPLYWYQVVYPFAITVATYTLGRCVGAQVAETLPIVERSHLTALVARLGGVSLALQVFSYGAGWTQIFWLVILRFASGGLCGYLCRVTNAWLSGTAPINSEEFYDCESNATVLRKARAPHLVLTTTTSNSSVIFSAGFTLSVLLGGVCFESLQTDENFQSLTGAKPFTVTPMFFVVLCVVGEACLRLLFWYVKSIGPPKVFEQNVTLKENDQSRGVKGGGIRRRKLHDPAFPALTHCEENDYSRFATQHYVTPVKSRSLSKELPFSPLRSHLNSVGSAQSEFFDCESFGDIEDLQVTFSSDDNTESESLKAIEWGVHEKTDLAIYRENKCVYESGSPAFVPVGECEAIIPDNFIRCWGEKRASKMWREMQQWRKDSNIWRIHAGPHHLFHEVKSVYFQHFHGVSKLGLPILYEKPGKMMLKEFFQSGVSIHEMTHHYFYMMEYISNVLSLKEEVMNRRGVSQHSFSNWQFSVVMDVEGISMSMVSKDVIKYMTHTGDVNTRYYPLSTGRVFVVNAPFWLAGVWAGMKSLAPDSLTIEILSKKNTLETLLKYIDEDQIPEEYGGKSPYPTDKHPYELEMWELVKKHLSAPEFETLPLASIDHDSSKSQEFSFDFSDKKWMSDHGNVHGHVSETINGVTRKSEISVSPLLHHRTWSLDRQHGKLSPMTAINESDEASTREFDNSDGSLLLVSFLYLFWFAVHGSVEFILPIYVLTPPILGGLGYSPARSGFVFFCASILIQWLMKSQLASYLSSAPSKDPMRGFRIGVGAKCIFLSMIPLFPNAIVSAAKVKSVLNMFFMIILMTGLAISSMLGLSAISIMHQIACENYVKNPGKNCLSNLFGKNRLLTHCSSGKLSTTIQAIAVTIGNLAVAPIYTWSMRRERPTPLDASITFFALATTCLSLYILSFSFLLARGSSENNNLPDSPKKRKICAFLVDFVTVPFSDVTALLRDLNISFARQRHIESLNEGLDVELHIS